MLLSITLFDYITIISSLLPHCVSSNPSTPGSSTPSRITLNLPGLAENKPTQRILKTSSTPSPKGETRVGPFFSAAEIELTNLIWIQQVQRNHPQRPLESLQIQPPRLWSTQNQWSQRIMGLRVGLSWTLEEERADSSRT